MSTVAVGACNSIARIASLFRDWLHRLRGLVDKDAGNSNYYREPQDHSFLKARHTVQGRAGRKECQEHDGGRLLHAGHGWDGSQSSGSGKVARDRSSAKTATDDDDDADADDDVDDDDDDDDDDDGDGDGDGGGDDDDGDGDGDDDGDDDDDDDDDADDDE